MVSRLYIFFLASPLKKMYFTIVQTFSKVVPTTSIEKIYIIYLPEMWRTNIEITISKSKTFAFANVINLILIVYTYFKKYSLEKRKPINQRKPRRNKWKPKK